MKEFELEKQQARAKVKGSMDANLAWMGEPFTKYDALVLLHELKHEIGDLVTAHKSLLKAEGFLTREDVDKKEAALTHSVGTVLDPKVKSWRTSLQPEDVAQYIKDLKPTITPMAKAIAEFGTEKEVLVPLIKEEKSHLQKRQEKCSHKDNTDRWAFNLQHNFHDEQPRGHCPLCGLIVSPAYWDSRPVVQDDKSVQHARFVVPAHPLYHIIEELEHKNV